jgi:hypothetical protein
MKLLLFIAVFLLAPSLSHAFLLNGDFETGSLSPWETIGDVLLVNSSFGVNPPQGHLQVLMTTAPAEVGSFGYEHPQSYSGTDAIRNGSLANPFFGFSFPQSPLQIDVSGVKQSFVAETDLLLSFTWSFLTDEGGTQGSVLDGRFYVLDGVAQMLVPTGTAPSSPTPFAFGFGYEMTTIFIGKGLHTVGFGVFDVADHHTNSGLLLDDISFRAVPEPGTWLLFGVGLVAVNLLSKHRRLGRKVSQTATKVVDLLSLRRLYDAAKALIGLRTT